MSKLKISKKDRFEQAQFLLPLFWDTVTFPQDWTFEEVLDLHEYLLNESLKALAKSGGGKAQIERKIEALEWIFAPDIEINALEVVDGQLTRVSKMPRALSFQLCCMMKGADPDELRAQLMSKLDNNFKRAITAYQKAA